MPDHGDDRDSATISELRDAMPEGVLVTGDAAWTLDFSDRLQRKTPLVIAFVLGLALLLLPASFRSRSP